MDDRLISSGDLLVVDMQLRNGRRAFATRRLMQMEPELFEYIDWSINAWVGEMVLQDMDAEAASALAYRMMSTFIIVLEATNHATYRLWGESLKGTPLAHLRSLLQDRADGGSHPR